MRNSQTPGKDFTTALLQSGLMSQSELSEFAATHGPADGDKGLARSLTRAGCLTRFQARHLLAGRWRGLVIDGYRIEEPLSLGGMGEVFVARQADSKKPVAVKVLRQRYREHPQLLQRFRLEAFALTTLQHPHLLRGLATGTFEQGRYRFPFLVTELIPGPNLHELIQLKGRIAWQGACTMLVQVGEALHYVHREQFVHRDVKPANILLRPTGEAKLADFGVAAYHGPQGPLLKEMIPHRGTVGYSAPEQLRSPADPRLDIYSLGCTLFYSLTGKVPEEQDFPLDLSKYRSDVPRQVEAVIQKATDLDVNSRFQTAQGFADALREYGSQNAFSIDYQALLRARSKARRTGYKRRIAQLEVRSRDLKGALDKSQEKVAHLQQQLDSVTRDRDRLSHQLRRTEP
jgi:serine/threonine-protein kinase